MLRKTGDRLSPSSSHCSKTAAAEVDELGGGEAEAEAAEEGPGEHPQRVQRTSSTPCSPRRVQSAEPSSSRLTLSLTVGLTVGLKTGQHTATEAAGPQRRPFQEQKHRLTRRRRRGSNRRPTRRRRPPDLCPCTATSPRCSRWCTSGGNSGASHATKPVTSHVAP